MNGQKFSDNGLVNRRGKNTGKTVKEIGKPENGVFKSKEGIAKSIG